MYICIHQNIDEKGKIIFQPIPLLWSRALRMLDLLAFACWSQSWWFLRAC